MYDENLYSSQENSIKEEDKSTAKEIVLLLKDKSIDSALSILFATRKAIVRASAPKSIDNETEVAIMNEIEGF